MGYQARPNAIAVLILMALHTVSSAVVRVQQPDELAKAFNTTGEDILVLVTMDLDLKTILKNTPEGPLIELIRRPHQKQSLAIQGGCVTEEGTPRKCILDLGQGGIQVFNFRYVWLSQVAIVNGRVDGVKRLKGGCMYLESTTLYLTEVKMEGCHADGAIKVPASGDEVASKYGGEGGAIAMYGGSVYISDSEFKDNKAVLGGAMHYIPSTKGQDKILFQRSNFTNNISDGVIFEGDLGTTGDTSYDKFLRNKTTGGVILVDEEATPGADQLGRFVIVDSIMSGNRANTYSVASDIAWPATFFDTSPRLISNDEFLVWPSEPGPLPEDWQSKFKMTYTTSAWFASTSKLFGADRIANPPIIPVVEPVIDIKPTTPTPKAPNDHDVGTGPSNSSRQATESGNSSKTPWIVIGVAIGLVLLCIITAACYVLFIRTRRPTPAPIEEEFAKGGFIKKIEMGTPGDIESQDDTDLWTSTNSHLLGLESTTVSAATSADDNCTTDCTRLSQNPITMVDRANRARMRRVLGADLDYMASHNILLLDRFIVKGASSRRHGGQGVVQFVTNTLNGVDYAIKFFLENDSFVQEQALYMDLTLQKMMPAVNDVYANEDGALRGRSGTPLPPFLVIERGESLNEWAIKSSPDFWTAMMVLGHIADRLQQLHAHGLVHRDLKPENILWRPRFKEWTLIDFGCTCEAGEVAKICYSPYYAAPEVMRAIEDGHVTLKVDASLDMWSFGVIAFELLTQSRAFPSGTKQKSVTDKLLGRSPLPWEPERLTPARHHQLKKLKPSVLLMLQRDQRQRPNVQELRDIWDGLFAGDTIPIGDESRLESSDKEGSSPASS